EVRVGARRLALSDHLVELLVEGVHLLDVPLIELEVLGELGVRDSIETLQVVECLWRIRFHSCLLYDLPCKCAAFETRRSPEEVSNHADACALDGSRRPRNAGGGPGRRRPGSD